MQVKNYADMKGIEWTEAFILIKEITFIYAIINHREQ